MSSSLGLPNCLDEEEQETLIDHIDINMDFFRTAFPVCLKLLALVGACNLWSPLDQHCIPCSQTNNLVEFFHVVKTALERHLQKS